MGKIQRERAAAKNLKPSTKQALAEKLGQDATPVDPLPPILVTLCYIAAVIATLACVTGIAGIAVLLDVRTKEHWYSHTKFAELWLQMVDARPLLTPLFVNGGAAGILSCGKVLYKHYSAIKMKKKQ